MGTKKSSRPRARWLAIVALGGALYLGMLNFMIWSLKCSDGCDSAEGWRGDTQAWQWQVLGILGLIGLLLAVVFVIMVFLQLRISAGIVLGAYILIQIIVLWEPRNQGYRNHWWKLTPDVGWALLILLIFGALAIFYTPTEKTKKRLIE